MNCIICESGFYHQTMSEPAESCDCGRCLSRLDARESNMDKEAVAELRAKWNAKVEEMNKPSYTPEDFQKAADEFEENEDWHYMGLMLQAYEMALGWRK